MTISDEAVEAAKKVAYERYGSKPDAAYLRTILEAAAPYMLAEAAAPHLMARALYEAANELEYGNPIGEWLCDRADQIEGKQ